MEGASGDHRGQQQRSVTSFSDLFGDRKDSAASRSGVFPVLFTTPPSSSTAKGSGSSRREASWRKDDNGRPVDRTRNSSSGMRNQIDSSQGLNTQRLEEVAPSHFGLSVYYGAQDMYVPSQPSTATENTNSFSRNNSEDEPSWWQGSFYY